MLLFLIWKRWCLKKKSAAEVFPARSVLNAGEGTSRRTAKNWRTDLSQLVCRFSTLDSYRKDSSTCMTVRNEVQVGLGWAYFYKWMFERLGLSVLALYSLRKGFFLKTNFYSPAWQSAIAANQQTHVIMIKIIGPCLKFRAATGSVWNEQHLAF